MLCDLSTIQTVQLQAAAIKALKVSSSRVLSPRMRALAMRVTLLGWPDQQAVGACYGLAGRLTALASGVGGLSAASVAAVAGTSLDIAEAALTLCGWNKPAVEGRHLPAVAFAAL
jgi:hypothetical protein